MPGPPSWHAWGSTRSTSARGFANQSEIARLGIVNRMTESLWVELFPRDLESSVSFYTEIMGFRVDRDDRDRAFNYVSLVRGTVRLGLGSRPKEPSSPTLARWSVEIVLEVDDIDAEY